MESNIQLCQLLEWNTISGKNKIVLQLHLKVILKGVPWGEVNLWRKGNNYCYHRIEMALYAFFWQILLKNPSARHKQGCKKLQSSMYRPMRCKFQEDRKKEKEQWSHNKMLWLTDCDVRLTRIDLALGDNVLTLLPWLMKVKKYSFLPYKYSTQMNTPCQFKSKP